MVEEKKKFCRHCGSQNDADAVFCTECGKEIEGVKIERNNVQSTIVERDKSILQKLLSNKKILGGIGVALVAIIAFVLLNQFELKGSYANQGSTVATQSIEIKGNKSARFVTHVPETGNLTFEFKLTQTDERDSETNQVIYKIDDSQDVKVEYDMLQSAIAEAGIGEDFAEMATEFGLKRKETKNRVMLSGSFSSHHPAITEMLNTSMELTQTENGDILIDGETFFKQ